MNYSDKKKLKVGDIVEHETSPGDPAVQGPGLLTRLNKKGSRAQWNLWEVKFFNGSTFEMLEEYLKKTQGTVDSHE
jgi:hypothetical protein|tara:strand:- start:68 stop:295 length:228 start_codon:yes stop_codon:yes gene_type:complete